MKGNVRFKVDRETKGAVRFQEVDGDGNPVTTKDENCAIGTLYLRKNVFNGGKVPTELTAQLEW